MVKFAEGMDEKNLATIFDLVQEHKIALPELQRPSVWYDSQIPRLLESVYRGYPFGIFLLWTPSENEQIRCRAFCFEDFSKRDTLRKADHYLIDGQQRLTAFYKALHVKGDLAVAFNLKSEEFSLRDAEIKQKLKDPRNHYWYLLKDLIKNDPQEHAKLINQIYDTHKSKLSKNHLDSIFEQSSGHLERLRPSNIQIPIYNIDKKSYSEVTEIFERINLGTPVRKSYILLGKLSNKYKGVVSRVEQYISEMRKKNGRRFDLDLLMSGFTATTIHSEKLNFLENKYIAENIGKSRIKIDLDKTEKAIIKALKFIEKYLFIDTLKYFPAERTLVCLSFLFSNKPKYMQKELNRNKVALWVAWALLTGRHGDLRRMHTDILIIEENCKQIAELLMKELDKKELKQQIGYLYSGNLESPINRNDSLFSLLYGIIRWKDAVSFYSKKPIRIRVVEESDEDDTESSNKVTSNNKDLIDEHHIFPLARLKELEEKTSDEIYNKQWRNDIANLTFITIEDNRERIKDRDTEYLREISSKIKQMHLIDDGAYVIKDYKKFLKSRRRLIKIAAKNYYRFLASKARFPLSL